jgi:ribonuclease HII
VAKVQRDRIMEELGRQYPGYGLGEHKGYGTQEHCLALEELGPCAIHRLTFEPLRSRAQMRMDL